ncbi:MAG: type I restriction endonuclease subunit R [Phycisphaeraceae bacterium]|nr:type I restriction endonuclease subunit R [Phycisphaeraceae bacterium]
MTTDTSERGLESLIVDSLVNDAGYARGNAADFDREHCVDWPTLLGFLKATQPEKVAKLDLDAGGDGGGPKRTKFLARLTGEIAKRGVVDVLRKGVSDGPVSLDLFYGTPHAANAAAVEKHAQNVFTVTRQVRFSPDERALSLDVVIFINGLPVATFELKNRLTKQTVDDAVQQYKNDRDPREKLFEFGRCLVHFAVDDQEVRFCTQLRGKDSWFLPFNKGYNDGAGNPPNPDGLKTDYLWKQILIKDGLTDIIENYAQVVETKDTKTGRKKSQQIFPRYHQLDVVRKVLADVAAHGVGKRYLIQHSAGSGKSNSIAWLAHQLIAQEKDGKPIFDSVVVITDRRILDEQIRETIRKFAQVSAVIGAVGTGTESKTKQLTKFLADGKKIIISTVQTFPFVLDEIGSDHRGRSFAIIIDEAHSSQGSRTSAKLNMALSAADDVDEEASVEDRINAIIEQKKMLTNASYFAFTATPKNKTLEVFGEPYTVGNVVKHRPFHAYSMKQAIDEGFILDVLRHYTPVESYYRLMTTVQDDPQFDVRKANKKLRAYVERHQHAIRSKAEIMVDHFHDQVIAKQKIGGEARAMVITGSIQRAIEYFHAFRDYLTERKSPYRAIVAFSGEHEYPERGGSKVTEASLNGFPSGQIASKIQEDPYRFLICADKFQTGYDEPLLHTMYVDKQLSGIKAVQTLSRLNRAHPKKRDTFVLDFSNDPDTIKAAFDDYYRTTLLSSETDPNKLHDLKAALDKAQVYNQAAIDELVKRFLDGEPRDRLDPILDKCVEVYKQDLKEDGQIEFKGKAKSFLRTYGFLSAILPYANPGWEKLSMFLNFLVPKLPAPEEEDLSKGVLDAIDMESYRNEVKAELSIVLADKDAEIEPVPIGGGGGMAEPELDRLSNIVKSFNEMWGGIEWNDKDKIRKVLTEELPATVAADTAYQNAMKNSDKQNARLEHDKALGRAMTDLVSDHTELFKQFSDNEGFRRWLTETIFALTYNQRDNRGAA